MVVNFIVNLLSSDTGNQLLGMNLDGFLKTFSGRIKRQKIHYLVGRSLVDSPNIGSPK